MAGFIRGVLWGSVAAVGGLVVVSQVAPPARPPVDEAAVPAAAAPATGAESQGTTAPQLSADEPEVVGQTVPADTMGAGESEAAPAGTAPEPATASEVTETDAPTPTAGPASEPSAVATVPAEPTQEPASAASAPLGPDAADAATSVPDMPQPEVSALAPDVVAPAANAPMPEAPRSGGDGLPAPSAAPDNLSPPAVADAGAEAPAAPQEAPPPPPSDAPGGELTMAEAAIPPASVARLPEGGADQPAVIRPGALSEPSAEQAPDAPDLPPPPPLTPEEEAMLQPPSAGATATDESAGLPAVAEPAPDPAPPAESTLPPAPGLDDTASGVITGRLPRIGDAAPDDPDAVDPDAVAEGTADVPTEPMTDDPSLPPLQRFARAFDNPDGKPLFSLLLEDDGAEVDRAALAALDLPLTIVIDPLAEGAADRAAVWRAGGQEVVMTARDLPPGATPGDLEQIFQALAQRLPEAVAVIDVDGDAFQGDRRLSAQVVAILAGQGRGLVTLDQGLNAADQVARREGLASVSVFRRFDPDNASGPAVKRYLDRAVFRAAQEGQVAVIGSLRPETVAGLLEWSVEGRASSVALAPISALLGRNGN